MIPPGKVFSAFVFLLFGLAVSAPAFSAAPVSTPDSIQIKKNLVKNKKDLAALKKRLEEEKKKQHLAQKKERNVLSRLQRVDQKLGSLRRQKEVNQQDLEETRVRIDRLQSEMRMNQERLAQSHQLLKQRLQALYRMSFRKPFFGGILDSESFSDLARKLRFGLVLAQSNEKILSQTLRHQQGLQRDEAQWGDEERRKTRIVSVLGKQEKNYSEERVNRTHFLASIRQEQTLRQQTIEEMSETARDLQAKVAFFLRQATTARKKSNWVPATGTGLMVKRGRIPWPVSGRIISPFGKYKNPDFNAVVENTGVQIQAPLGTSFRAVEGGLVRFADWFKGYGKLVILDHGQGYYSLYAQASELNVSEGQTVVEGQILGTVGDTGSLVGSSLYFEIRQNGVPKDPLHWLKRKI